MNYENIANTLATDGVIILPDFLPSKLTEQLYQYISNIPADQFSQAGIGRNNNVQINHEIRNDVTLWLNGKSPCERTYLMAMNELRHQLNEKLFLGLFDYESHYSHYKMGSYYQRHVDAFEGRSNRVITTVFYLNHDWSENDGGELVIYKHNSKEVLHRISPTFGTLAIFLSEKFPHEVLTANRDRYSIAGWFRIDRPF
ncbi:MAG: proline hydroxylase [Methylophaga sp.]|nr:MAG: proline hydroxylase [Methylophaga sp.]